MRERRLQLRCSRSQWCERRKLELYLSVALLGTSGIRRETAFRGGDHDDFQARPESRSHLVYVFRFVD